MSSPFGLMPSIFRAAFGDELTYHPKAGGDSAVIRGIFRNPGTVARPFGAAVATEKPTLSLVVSDLPDGGKIGAEVAIGSKFFRVSSATPDGHGMIRCELREIEALTL